METLFDFSLEGPGIDLSRLDDIKDKVVSPDISLLDFTFDIPESLEQEELCI